MKCVSENWNAVAFEISVLIGKHRAHTKLKSTIKPLLVACKITFNPTLIEGDDVLVTVIKLIPLDEANFNSYVHNFTANPTLKNFLKLGNSRDFQVFFANGELLYI